MKRRIFFVALLVTLALALVGCGTYNFDFTVSNPEHNFGVTPDPDVKVDAVREEALYGDNTISFSETRSGIKVTTWTYFGFGGLYLYSETDDTSVYYSKEKAFFQNDSVEYYIDPIPATRKP